MRRFAITVISLASVFAVAPLANARTLPSGSRPSRRSIVRDVRAAAAKREAKRSRVEASRSGTPVILDNFGVSFHSPLGWKVDTTSGTEGNVTLAVMLLAPDTVDEPIRHNMNLVFEDLSMAPLTLGQYTDVSLEYERGFFDTFTLLFRDQTTLLGKPTQLVQFDASYSGVTMRFEQQWFINENNRAVIWTFADAPETFDKHLPLFHAVLDSFEMR